MNKPRTVLFRLVSLLICAVLIMGPVLPAQAAVLEPTTNVLRSSHPIAPQTVTTTLLSEDFESGVLPAGWQVIGTPSWRFDNPGGKSNNTGGAGNFAIADSDYAGEITMTTELRTPVLDLTGYTVATLNFKFAFMYYGNEAGDIDVSLDGGATWPYNIWHIDRNTPTVPLNVALPPQAIGQSNVKLRFRYSNAYFAWYWQIDEVRVVATGGAQPPVAPGPISFGTIATTSIVVNWADNSTNETGFNLERSINGTSGWTPITTTGANVAAYADTGLTCNTVYFYRVRATNASGDSAYSTVNSISTASCPPTAPAVPGNLAVTSAGTTQIGLSWQDNSPNETGFKLERSPDGSTNWVQISLFAANATTGADSTAACGSTYYYRLRATNAIGDSAYTDVVNGTTTACPPAVPAAPSGVAATLTTTTQLNLAWTDNSVNETNFSILRSPNGASSWTIVGTVNANVTTYANTGLTCNTTYYYAVRAYNANGNSPFSNIIQATTLACPAPAPAAPSNLTSPAARQTEATLNWVDNSNNETGFKIERSPNGSTGWAEIDTVAAGVTTYLNTGLTCNTRYSYRVRATNASGDSAYSNAVDALTAACNTALTALNEPFNSPSLPAGWVISPTTGATAWAFVNIFTDTQPVVVNGVPGGGTYFAVANSDAAGQVAMDTELRTPSLNLSANTGVKLTFKTYFQADQTSTADVDVSVNGGTTWTNIWRTIGSSPKGSVTMDVPQAVGQSNVRFRFHYYNANYAWYWLVDDVEVANALASAPPSAPSNLTAQVSGSNVVVDWTDNSSTEANFIIERSADGSTGWVEAGRVGANATTFTHQNVVCNTTVYYRVKATSGGLSSAYSNSANVTTPICTTVLNAINENFNGTAAPAGWTVVNYFNNRFWEFDQPSQLGTTGNAPIARNGKLSELRTPVLNYQNTSAVLLQFSSKLYNFADQSPAQGVQVDVSRDDGATWTTVWQKNTRFDGVERISLDISAQAANQASVMVRFMSRLHYTNEFWQIDDVALGPLSAPTTPANLLTTLTDVSGVLLAWSGSAGSNFNLERSTNGVNWSQITDITDGATTYVDNNVVSFTGYQYRVRAYNTAGQSSFSTAANVTTGDRSIRYVDVTISLYPTATIDTPANRARYEAIIRYFADGVYESSNGVNRLRKITIYPGQQNWDTANVQWTPSCHPMANVGGYVKSKQHVYMCDSFGRENYLTDDYAAQAGGYGSLTHEWGHYFYGLYDEYAQGNGTDLGSPRKTDTASKYSAMCTSDPAADTATEAGDLRWLNFSNNTQYFSLSTAQGRVYNASAWQVLARPKSEDPQNSSAELRPYWPELAAVAPGSGAMPQIELPAGRDAARAQLQIVWMPAAGSTTRITRGPNATLAATNNVVREVVVDRSALMVDSGYLDEAKTALAAWFNQMPVGDTVGLIAFDSTASEILPLTDVVDQSTRDVLITSLTDLVAGDADTAPGVALQLALDTLTAPSVPTDTTRVVYFLTAGRHTTGTYPFAVVPGLQANDVVLYTLGFDPLAGDKAELRQLAELTEGQYTNVLAASDLQKALSQSDQDTSLVNDVTLAYDAVDVAAGTTVTVPVTADPSLANLEFRIGYYGEPVSATLTVIDPLETPHPINTATDCTTTGIGADAETVCEVSYPSVVGYWAIEAHAVSDVYVVYYVSAVAAAGQSTYDAVINGMGEPTVAYPQPIVVEAMASRDFPIAGLGALGWAYEPDGSWSPVEFHDDGIAPDRIADDGTYSAYVDYKQDGEHWVTVHFDNHADMGYYTDRGLLTTGEQTYPAITEDFERYAEYQVTVSGWQEDDHADWPDDPNWPATPLSLDNVPAHGRIDYANDVDVFAVTVPNDYTQTLGVRINHLGLGMDPYVYVYAADYSWEFDRYIDYAPTSDDALFFPVDAAPGETFFIEVWHYSEEADTGTYNVSAGQYLSSDPIAQDKIMYKVYLPLMVR